MDLREVKEKLLSYGVIGAGGAGFPTYAKLNDSADTIILNCAECEPLLKVDRQLLPKYTSEIVSTLDSIVKLIGAKEGIIALKSKYKAALEAVEYEVRNYSNINLRIIDDVYPAGDEVVLVYETTGRIVPEGNIPMAVGVIVINVETCLNIYNALNLEMPVIYKYVTIAGEVKNPVTLKVPIGTPVEKLINLAGGTTIDDYKILMGGPMTGRISNEKGFVTKTTKAIIVLPDKHKVIVKKQANTSISIKRAMSVCSQCQMCTDICPRFLIGHSIEPHKVMNALANGVTTNIDAFTTTMLCSQCNLCEMYSCHQGLSPKTLIAQIKSGLTSKGIKNPHHKEIEEVRLMRQGRKVPMKRLIARLSLTKYDVAAPLRDEVISVDKVILSLSQHIGKASDPVVKIGDKVLLGEEIAKVKQGNLGVSIHSSISGVVTSIDNTKIIIQSRGV